MKIFNRAAVMAALGLLAAGQASAVTLYTAPALAGFHNEEMRCQAVNVRTKPIDVTIEMHDYSGNITDFALYTIQPGFTAGFAVQGGTRAYCKFTVSGGKTSVRASANYLTDMNAPTLVIPAR